MRRTKNGPGGALRAELVDYYTHVFSRLQSRRSVVGCGGWYWAWQIARFTNIRQKRASGTRHQEIYRQRIELSGLLGGVFWIRATYHDSVSIVRVRSSPQCANRSDRRHLVVLRVEPAEDVPLLRRNFSARTRYEYT